MTINDLLAPNETVKLSGTITWGEGLADITLTNLCVYIFTRDGANCVTLWYDKITRVHRRENYPGKCDIIVYSSDGGYNFEIYKNGQWADQIYCAIKHGRDGARNGNSAATVAPRSRTDNPFNF